MNESIEKLAAVMHDAWRAEKIKAGWHISKHCPVTNPPATCKDCHPCVDVWENLTDKEKELALMNSKLAHEYFENNS